ncbi:MAG: MAPEG family protein [Marinosulfonomonas sp.]|nr:MAPEG family protein [Marinosulfonomonas sp.]
MTPELTILTYAALLQAVQLSLAIVFADAQFGIKYGASARDTPRPLTGLAGRLSRALDNHYAALALFTIAVIVVTLGDKSTPLTITCAWTYLIARIAYVPAYISGIPYLRSIIWTIASGATLTMLIGALI